eukprot:COSAG01_NODE_6208_length_3794_cov_2.218133_3_plen_61_part_00
MFEADLEKLRQACIPPRVVDAVLADRQTAQRCVAHRGVCSDDPLPCLLARVLGWLGVDHV